MTADERGFQAAIDASPNDGLPRLAFADWLDDRGDPRGPGYRALGQLGLLPHHEPARGPWREDLVFQGRECWEWWHERSTGIPRRNILPAAWMDAVACRNCYRPDGVDYSKDFRTRALADDAAALAWSDLTDGQRADILAAGKAVTAWPRPRNP